MKHLILLLIIFALPFGNSFNNYILPSNSFELLGSLYGNSADSALLSYENASGQYVQKKVVIAENKFMFVGDINRPVIGSIYFKRKGEILSRIAISKRVKEVYLEPSRLTISGNPDSLSSIRLKGSKTETEKELLNNSIKNYAFKVDSIISLFEREKDTKKADVLRGQITPYHDKIKKIAYEYFLAHPNSFLTANLILSYVTEIGIDSSLAVYTHYNTLMKKSPEGIKLAEGIKQRETGLPYSIATNFSTVDMNGKTISLKNFRGKYVLLDFWASWCIPCRLSNPQLIKLYTIYKKNGLEIIGVADDDKHPDLWKKAIAKDGTKIWLHVLRGRDEKSKVKINTNDIFERFGVSYLPTKILIDPNGKIIGRYGMHNGDDLDMQQKFHDIFDNQ